MTEVALAIDDDTRFAGGGHGRLTFPGLAARHRGRALKLTFRRGGERDPWLGRRGWQASATEFEPVRVEADGPDLVVTMGQDVGALIEQLTVVEASIPELDVRGRAVWDVTPVHAPSSGGPRQATVRIPFQAGAEGDVVLDDPGPDGPALPRRVLEGHTLLGVEHQRLRAAFKGELEIDVAAGRARVLRRERWPRHVTFRIHGDGRIDLADEAGGGYAQTVAGGRPVFGISPDALRTAAARGAARILLDEATGLGSIEEPQGAPSALRFEATAEGDVSLDAAGARRAGVPEGMAPGESVLGIRHKVLVEARGGELVVDADGRTRVQAGPGWPLKVAFKLREDGGIDLAAAAGGGYAETVSGSRPVFGIPVEDLRKAASDPKARIHIPSGTAAGRIERPHRAVWPFLLAALLVLILAGAGAWFWKGEWLICRLDPTRCPIVADACPPDCPREEPAVEPVVEDPVVEEPVVEVPVVEEPVAEEPVVEEPVVEEPVVEEPVEPQPVCPPDCAGPAERHQAALEALARGETDLARALFRENDRIGYGPSQLVIAEAIDSLEFQAGLFSEADDVEAARLYKSACLQGDPRARELLLELEASLLSRGAEGDRVALQVAKGPVRDAKEACP